MLHTDRLGSGSKGKCIESRGTWFTPKEFETFGGRQTSKDWKRSIKIQGKSFFHYVNSGELNVHAFNCYCSTCSGQPQTSEDCNPVKLFSPPNRKRRIDDESYVSMIPMNKKPIVKNEDNNGIDWDSSEILAILKGSSNNTFSIPSSSNTLDDANMTPNEPSPHPSPSQPSSDEKKYRTFKKNMMEQADKIISRSKQIEGKLVNLDTMVSNLQKDVFLLKTIINTSPMPADQRTQVEINVGNAGNLSNVQPGFVRSSITDTLSQVLTRPEFAKTTTIGDEGLCVNCNRPAQFKCGRCNKVRYCNEFCQQKDWSVHMKLCEQASKGKQRKTSQPTVKTSVLGEMDVSKLKADISNCIRSAEGAQVVIKEEPDSEDYVVNHAEFHTEADHMEADHTEADHTEADYMEADHTEADHTEADHTSENNEEEINEEEEEEGEEEDVMEDNNENVDSDNFLNKENMENGENGVKETGESFLNGLEQNGRCEDSNGSDVY